MSRRSYDWDSGGSEFNSPKPTDSRRSLYKSSVLQKLEEEYKNCPRLTRKEAMKQRLFDTSHQVSDKSFSSDFEQESCSEVSSPRYSPEWGLSRGYFFSPPPTACRTESTQLSPLAKRLSISSHDDIPKPFHEPLTQKIFCQDVSDITYESDIVSQTKESSRESSEVKMLKTFHSASPNNDNMHPSCKQNKVETDDFPPLVNAYLNDLINNIYLFKSQMGTYLLNKMSDFDDEKSGTSYAENVLKYGQFEDNSFTLPLTDIKKISDKIYLKNKLEENANRLKYFKEQTVELSLFAQHANSWLVRSQEEITTQLKLIDSTMFIEQPTSAKAENTNELMLSQKNHSAEEKLVADCSTMTSLVISEDDSSSLKESRTVKEIGNHRTLTTGENNKKIVKVCNVSTMTEKKKHHSDQSGKHKNLNTESSTEAFNSCDKKSDDLKKTCDANTMASHSSKGKTIPKSLKTGSSTEAGNSCDKKIYDPNAMTIRSSKRPTIPKSLNKESSTEACNSSDKKRGDLKMTRKANIMTSHSSRKKDILKNNSLNKTEVSKSSAVKLHSSDEKKQKSKLSSSITTTHDLVGKKSKQESSLYIKLRSTSPIRVYHLNPKPKQNTKYTMTSDISDYESIVDSALNSLLEDCASIVVSEESSSDELLQSDENCSQASEENTTELGSSVDENCSQASEENTIELGSLVDENCSQASEENTLKLGSLVDEELESSTNSFMDLTSNTKQLHPIKIIEYDLEKTRFAGSTSAASSSFASSAKESPPLGSREKIVENLCLEKDFKPHRKRTSSPIEKHFSRMEKCDNRSSASSDTSTTSCDEASTSSDEEKKKKAEPTPCKVSKSIEKYGLATPNLSFETKNFMDRFNLVMPRTKEKSSKSKKKNKK